jgi:hypothetical protein
MNAVSSFKRAVDDKGRTTSMFKSNSSRFAPTVTEESSSITNNGEPEADPPCKVNTTLPLEWGKLISKRSNLRKGFVRLGNFKAGECEGVMDLPAPGTWRIAFQVKCGEKITVDSWNTHDTNDTVEVLINDETVRVVPNIPQGHFNSKSGQTDNGTTAVSCVVQGQSFTFRFKFRSSTERFLSHQMVMDGTATCISIDKAYRTATRAKTIRKGLPAPRVSKPAHITRKQYNSKTHPWITGKQDQDSMLSSTNSLPSGMDTQNNQSYQQSPSPQQLPKCDQLGDFSFRSSLGPADEKSFYAGSSRVLRVRKAEH